MINKFTFKEHKPTGRYKSFYNSYWDIKLKKKACGHIHRNDDGEFTITLSIKKEKTKEDPCSFRNAKLKAKFSTIEETKNFLEQNTNKIIELYDLYFHED